MKVNDLSVTFHTENIRECVDFYVQYFNVQVVFDAGWYVTIRFQNELKPGLLLSFIDPSHSDKRMFTGGMSLNLSVNDVDYEYERFKQAGFSFLEDIEDHDWGDRGFSISDPIGNLVYIYSEREISEKYKEAVREI